eukprot:1190017-Prorocentrum_minimum.AAC.2
MTSMEEYVMVATTTDTLHFAMSNNVISGNKGPTVVTPGGYKQIAPCLLSHPANGYLAIGWYWYCYAGHAADVHGVYRRAAAGHFLHPRRRGRGWRLVQSRKARGAVVDRMGEGVSADAREGDGRQVSMLRQLSTDARLGSRTISIPDTQDRSISITGMLLRLRKSSSPAV